MMKASKKMKQTSVPEKRNRETDEKSASKTMNARETKKKHTVTMTTPACKQEKGASGALSLWTPPCD